MITVLIIGEHHTNDKQNVANLKEFCIENHIVFATEHHREQEVYTSITCEVGDMICDLLSIVSTTVLFSRHLPSAPILQHNASSLSNIIETLEHILNIDPDLIGYMQSFYETKYQHPNLYQDLLPLLKDLRSEGNQQYRNAFRFLISLVNKCNNLHLDQSVFDEHHIFDSMPTGTTIEEQRHKVDQMHDQLECSLRDQVFVSNIKEILAMIQHVNPNGGKLIVTLGSSHVKGVVNQLKQACPEGVTILNCKSYDQSQVAIDKMFSISDTADKIVARRSNSGSEFFARTTCLIESDSKLHTPPRPHSR